MPSRVSKKNSPSAESVDVITQMRASYDRLTQSQKRIAEYVVEHPEAIAFSTVDQIATTLNVNPSTIVRFTYRLGLDGFPDLQARMQAQIRSRLASAEGSEEGLAYISHLEGTNAEASLKQDIANLQRTIQLLTAEDIEKAVNILVNARKVYVYAGLSSFATAHYFALILDRIRSNTALVSIDATMTSSFMSEIHSDDCLVAFTFPPYAATTRQISKWVKENNAQVIAITDTPVSALAQVADVVLLAACSGIVLQNSLIGPMAVANVVLNGLTVAYGDAALKRYARLNDVLNRWHSFILN